MIGDSLQIFSIGLTSGDVTKFARFSPSNGAFVEDDVVDDLLPDFWIIRFEKILGWDFECQPRKKL